ncbi:MAG: DUF1553 domain-containing protein [Rhodothermaceae bacterium]|nr:DUF1553 domain-containing protein [Rhodothermaceae bacterium]MYG69825.1 DUF1553 domain-containing protein [Rhodothermaceae bacterium]MYJ44638.1 DUF1553 domain-containing protein [Rhodothermaceae bacterium]
MFMEGSLAYHRIACIVFGLGVSLLGCSKSDPTLPDQVDFNYHIRPILSNSCYVCHGPDISTREADLRLDTYAGATAKRPGGRAIVPGNAKRSILIHRVQEDDPEQRMPPPQINKVLTEHEIALISKWIDQGAQYKTHWALIPPQKSEGPRSIDDLLQERIAAKGITPANPASRASLIRRASYVLTGLPPSPDAVQAFEQDESPNAYARVVDSLLASAAYGERWARHWMDLVRYSESKGHEFDFTIQGAWQYRDYLIRAFNEDVPYNQFVLEHLAGDVLEQPRRNPDDGFNESVIGTAYFALGEGKHSPVDTRIDEADRIDNIIDVTTKTFQGLTVACARCHDHKFDPIPTRDYYSLYGIVESARFTPVPILSDDYLEVVGDLVDLNQTLRSDIASRWQSSLGTTLAVPASRVIPRPPATQDTTGAREVLGDFRSGTLSGWIADGIAFDNAPLYGTPLIEEEHFLRLTEGVASSRQISEGLPGALRSPTFTLGHDSITVMAKGYKSALRLVIDNFQLIRAPIHGALDQELSSDTLTPHRFDVSLWKGHKAYLELLAGTYNKNRFVTDQHMLIVHDSSYFEIAYALAHNDAGFDLPRQERSEAALEPAIRAWAAEKASIAQIAAINQALESGEFQHPQIHEPIRRKQQIKQLLPPAELFIGMTEGDRVTSAVFGRGNHKTPDGEPVPHRFLTALDSTSTPFIETSSGRLEFAQAIVKPSNPLTARVMVNRLWHHAFGRGIVETVDNFGAQGSLPTHPELLDDLALRFVESGWSVKSILREILLSDAFQRSSEPPAGILELDPSNLLLSHYPVRRLEAEAIRDGILATSGQLNPTMYGPPVPIHLTEFMKGRGRPAVNGPLDGEGRRSLYIAIRRNFLSPMMLSFDMPIPFSTFGARNSSNVPAQSLTMLNDIFIAEQARHWGELLIKQPHVDIKERIEHIYLKAFARLPEPDELEEAQSFFNTEAEELGLGPEDTMYSVDIWSAYCHVIFNQKEFIYLI